jgi:hypothetical protein
MLLNPDVSIQIDGPTGAERRPRRFRIVVMMLGAVLLIFAAFAAALAWQATRGGLSLDLLRSRIEAAIRSRLPAEADVAIGSAMLSYDGGLVLRAINVRLELPGVASIEAGEFTTVATPSRFLKGQVDLRSIAMTDVGIGVSVRSGSGKGASGSAPTAPPKPVSTAGHIRQASEAFTSAIRNADAVLRGAGLQDVTVRNATVFVDDGEAELGSRLKIRQAAGIPSITGGAKRG